MRFRRRTLVRLANTGWQRYASSNVAPTSAPLVLSVRLPGEE